MLRLCTALLCAVLVVWWSMTNDAVALCSGFRSVIHHRSSLKCNSNFHWSDSRRFWIVVPEYRALGIRSSFRQTMQCNKPNPKQKHLHASPHPLYNGRGSGVVATSGPRNSQLLPYPSLPYPSTHSRSWLCCIFGAMLCTHQLRIAVFLSLIGLYVALSHFVLHFFAMQCSSIAFGPPSSSSGCTNAMSSPSKILQSPFCESAHCTLSSSREEVQEDPLGFSPCVTGQPYCGCCGIIAFGSACNDWCTYIVWIYNVFVEQLMRCICFQSSSVI